MCLPNFWHLCHSPWVVLPRPVHCGVKEMHQPEISATKSWIMIFNFEKTIYSFVNVFEKKHSFWIAKLVKYKMREYYIRDPVTSFVHKPILQIIFRKISCLCVWCVCVTQSQSVCHADVDDQSQKLLFWMPNFG